MVKHKGPTGKIVNRKARHEYTLDDSFVVGISLSGQETKSLRQGRGQLTGSYVNIINGELWLVNCLISSGKTFVIPENEQTRTRKLLAHQKEIDQMIAAKQQGKAIVPLEFLTAGRYIKLRISTAKGKKQYDKRIDIKRRDQSREINRQIKH